jgi:cobalamin-dependent methionine synthase-like protein
MGRSPVRGQAFKRRGDVPEGTTEATQVFDHIPFVPDSDQFRRDVRVEAYPELGEELDRYIKHALGVVRPRAILRVAYVHDRDTEGVAFGGQRFSSGVLAENLSEINRVFVYVASCGPELYSMDLSVFDPFATFWHDVFKNKALEAARTFLTDRAREAYGIAQFASMNPGSGDADVWPISQQRELFTVLGDTESLIGVRLTESFLMVPDKSISGIFFPSETGYVNCQSCTRKVCPNRRAPYAPRG